MTDIVVMDEIVGVAVHELHHVLAFNTALYPAFPVPPARASGGAFLVTSPTVLSVARSYFNCPSLAAVPLETNGGSGTADVHWSQGVLDGELMVGATLPGIRAIYSAFTLAFLKGSGWYLPDFTKAFPIPWGAGAGCAWVATTASGAFVNTCAQAALAAPSPPPGVAPQICSSSTPNSSCDLDDLGAGNCSSIPFSSDTSCRQYKPFTNFICTDSELNSNNPFTQFGFTLGEFSRCILGDDTITRTDGVTISSIPFNTGCYTVGCDSTGSSVLVTLFGTQVAHRDARPVPPALERVPLPGVPVRLHHQRRVRQWRMPVRARVDGRGLLHHHRHRLRLGVSVTAEPSRCPQELSSYHFVCRSVWRKPLVVLNCMHPFFRVCLSACA